MDKRVPDYGVFGWMTEGHRKTQVLALAAITLAVGISFIGTSVLIATDGILYVKMAQQMAAGGVGETIHGTRQPIGYSFLVYLVHTGIGWLGGMQSLGGWILSAQAVSLLSKLAAVLAIYFVGIFFVGSGYSFWGVLILSILPDAVDFGSDALSEWPSMMFLSVGFLLLLLGAEHGKSWIWSLAGLTAGLGYLIRPECGQIAFYGGLWLVVNLVQPQGEMKKGRAALLLVLLMAGFAVIAVPYMQYKGYVFPEYRLWKLSSASPSGIDSIAGSNACLAGFSTEGLKGFLILINNVCETLVYYFVPALGIGVWYGIRKLPRISPRTFFITAFIVTNILMALMLSYYKGYLSCRHTFPLVAITIFFIPVGLQIIACWLSRRNCGSRFNGQESTRRWFWILTFVGISICGMKLVRIAPLRWDKQGYYDAAVWLNRNTDPNDVIAVPDKRIAFYAERQGIEYGSKIPIKAGYVVAVIGRKGNEPVFDGEMKEVYSTEMNRKKKDKKVVIYEAFRHD